MGCTKLQVPNTLLSWRYEAEGWVFPCMGKALLLVGSMLLAEASNVPAPWSFLIIPKIDILGCIESLALSKKFHLLGSRAYSHSEEHFCFLFERGERNHTEYNNKYLLLFLSSSSSSFPFFFLSMFFSFSFNFLFS